MSKVVARYFQKCDMCNQEFQLECEVTNWAKMPKYKGKDVGND